MCVFRRPKFLLSRSSDADLQLPAENLLGLLDGLLVRGNIFVVAIVPVAVHSKSAEIGVALE